MKTEDIKKMAQAWKEVQEASKKNEELKGNQHKLDHNKNGKIDADDFKGLRKKAKKESETEIVTTEAKTDVYHKHMLKALGKSRLPKDHQYTSAIANNGDFVVKDGGGRTVGRIPKGEHNLNEQQIDEISKKTLGSYIKKASDDKADNAYNLGAKDPLGKKGSWRKSINRRKGIEKATDRLTKEEVEQIDELKKSTLSSYIKKASGNMAGKTAVQVAKVSSSNSKPDPDLKRGLVNRMKGIGRAADKLAKEEAEQIDELSKDTLASYHKKSQAAMSNALKTNDPKELKKIGKRLTGSGRAYQKLKKESVEEAATHKPGVASPAGEGLSPSAKKELARKTPMPDFVNEPKIDKKTFDAIRGSGKKAKARNNDNAQGDKNIINKSVDITAKASKKEDDGFKDS